MHSFMHGSAVLALAHLSISQMIWLLPPGSHRLAGTGTEITRTSIPTHPPGSPLLAETGTRIPRTRNICHPKQSRRSSNVKAIVYAICRHLSCLRNRLPDIQVTTVHTITYIQRSTSSARHSSAQDTNLPSKKPCRQLPLRQSSLEK